MHGDALCGRRLGIPLRNQLVNARLPHLDNRKLRRHKEGGQSNQCRKNSQFQYGQSAVLLAKVRLHLPRNDDVCKYNPTGHLFPPLYQIITFPEMIHIFESGFFIQVIVRRRNLDSVFHPIYTFFEKVRGILWNHQISSAVFTMIVNYIPPCERMMRPVDKALLFIS